LKRLAGLAVVLGAIGLVTAFALWRLPSNDYLVIPDVAKPLQSRVDVQGGHSDAKGDVYYVDVYVRRIRLLERLLPFVRPDGATLVPAETLAPAGTTDEERRQQSAAEMNRSEQIASVVALRALGYETVAKPRGVLVTSVASDAPAAKVLDPDDVIVAADGAPVLTPIELRSRIGRHEPGDRVRLTVRRNGKPIDVTVRTVPSPEDPGRAIIGILVDQDAKISLPIDVGIDLGRVGGPSAGLPFALEIARQLGRNVTHGCRIAATGELALDGTVLPIGGIAQKTIGARRAHVDYFLVPVGANAQGARENAHGLPVVPVESFQQALRRLTTSRLKC
jgi:PDZ domain-containing protein